MLVDVVVDPTTDVTAAVVAVVADIAFDNVAVGWTIVLLGAIVEAKRW